MDTTRTVTEITTASAAQDERRLRWVLRANAAASIVAGAIATAAPSWLDDVLGTGHPGWVRAVGIGLLLFAVDVVLVARADRAALIAGTRVIVAVDAAWVAATAATILLGWYGTTGAIVMGVAGLGVADFAIAQHLLGRRLAA